MDITFLGAAGTVTGSKYLVEHGAMKILVDCGLFQGYKQLRLKNWSRLPIPPDEIHAVVLTHAHIDHSGYLPLLVRDGFAGKIYCSRGTRDLCSILLPDSGHLQEEEAKYAEEQRYSRHSPPRPLYTRLDGERALGQFIAKEFDEEIELASGFSFRMLPAGHIVGSSLIQIRNGPLSLLFSGDLGRPNDPIMNPPSEIRRADYLVLESTYGNRLHETVDPALRLADIINRTIDRRGIVLIPSFAVGRAQTILYLVHQLKTAGTIPDIPVFLNSPMAVEATEIYIEHRKEHRLSQDQCRAMARTARFVNSLEESKKLNRLTEPAVIISASGMASGGRILHHLKAYAPDPRNTVLFVGYQAGGTRGAAMLGGAKAVKIHGDYVPIRAEIVSLDQLSSHADYREIVNWLGHFDVSPAETFITHGEPAAADALRHRLKEELGWNCSVPEYLERRTLHSIQKPEPFRAT